MGVGKTPLKSLLSGLQRNVIPSCAMLLSIVLIDTSEKTIAKVLDTVTVFGHTKVRGCRGVSTGTQSFILVETSLHLNPDTVPAEVGIEREAGPSAVHTVESLATFNAVPKEDAFHAKLLYLLHQEGKSV